MLHTRAPSPAPVAPRPPAAGGLLGTVAARLARWRARRRASPGWTVAVALIVAVILLPIFTIIGLAFQPTGGMWAHLVANVLPRSATNTLLLLAGVGALTLATGTAAAWLVTMYRFPGRNLADRLLVLPLAMPTYIVAYCYVELLDYAGPVQGALRAMLGVQRPGEYWFPEIRSLPGAIFVLSSVLYPYAYLSARASFVQQSVCALEVARTLGRTPLGAFRSVALPMARPALAAGTALAMMEVLNDLGAVQYLGVETLSASIYATWLQRGSLAGAAQISAVLLVVVIGLFALERLARGRAASHHTTGRYRAIPFQDIEGWRGYAAGAACLLPFATGFLVPAALLVEHALGHWREAVAGGFFRAVLNSLVLAGIAAVAAVLIAVVLAYAHRTAKNGFTRPAIRLAGLAYAIPGTVLAVGLIVSLAAIDNGLDAMMRGAFGLSTGLILSGSLVALTLALVIRFLAVALGGIEAGLERISPNLDAASRALGATALSTLFRVHLPLLLPALGAAALMVFVDAMKELPATLLLRPFNFETLSTHVYGFASLENFEAASLGALSIVAVGLAPVLLLHQAVAGGRAGTRRR